MGVQYTEAELSVARAFRLVPFAAGTVAGFCSWKGMFLPKPETSVAFAAQYGLSAAAITYGHNLGNRLIGNCGEDTNYETAVWTANYSVGYSMGTLLGNLL